MRYGNEVGKVAYFKLLGMVQSPRPVDGYITALREEWRSKTLIPVHTLSVLTP